MKFWTKHEQFYAYSIVLSLSKRKFLFPLRVLTSISLVSCDTLVGTYENGVEIVCQLI